MTQTPSCSAPSAAPSGTTRTRTVRPEQALFALRGGLGLFANLRPITVNPSLISASPLKPELLEGVDCLIVRELTSGLYFGRPSEQRTTPDGERAAIDTLWYTEGEIRRIVTLAFELARGPPPQADPGGQGQRARDVSALAQGDRGGPRGLPGRGAGPPPGGLRRDDPRQVAGRLRRARDREPVRRHPLGRGGGHRRLAGDAAVGVARDPDERPTVATACTSPSTARRRTSPVRTSPTRWGRSCRRR